ncbi:MAG: 50S ribosomal protein L25 [bacterium]
MSKEIKLSASKRETSGTTAAKALRKTGFIPAIVYGEKGARSVKINTRDIDLMLKNHTSENLIVDLSVDGDVIKALLREVQHEAVMGGTIHADFLEISMTKKMRVTIAVELKGEPVGVSQQGGILEHLLRHIEVECLPGDLVESFEVDVTGMALGKTMMIRDIVLDPKFTVLTSGDVAVATVVAPREEKVEEAVPGAEVTPEVIGKKKEGEEGAAAAAAAPGKDGKKEEPKKDEKKPAAKK